MQEALAGVVADTGAKTAHRVLAFHTLSLKSKSLFVNRCETVAHALQSGRSADLITGLTLTLAVAPCDSTLDILKQKFNTRFTGKKSGTDHPYEFAGFACALLGAGMSVTELRDLITTPAVKLTPTNLNIWLDVYQEGAPKNLMVENLQSHLPPDWPPESRAVLDAKIDDAFEQCQRKIHDRS